MLTLSGCVGSATPAGETTDGADDSPIFTAGTGETPLSLDLACEFSVFLDNGSPAPTQLKLSGPLNLTVRSQILVNETPGVTAVLDEDLAAEFLFTWQIDGEVRVGLSDTHSAQSFQLAEAGVYAISLLLDVENATLQCLASQHGAARLELVVLPRLTGTVTDEPGAAIAGADVSVSGVSTTTTDAAGQFEVFVAFGWSGTITVSPAGSGVDSLTQSLTNVTTHLSLSFTQGDPLSPAESPGGGSSSPPPPPSSCTSDADCIDGLYCNGVETCNAGSCQTGTAVNCDDGVGCTDDSCNEGTDSCVNISSNTNCDNGLFCDGAETCHTTLDCQSGTSISCDDGVDCTDDSCNETTDQCDNTANDALCVDSLFCNGAETCDASLDCQSGFDPCPGQSCDEVTDTCNGCLVDADCDNGLYCDGAETCSAGTCLSGASPCSGQTCDETADACAGTIITLNPSATFQNITGWEATAQAGQEDSPAFDNYKDALFDLAVNDLGLNRIRLEVKSGAENQEDFWQQFQDGLIPDRNAVGSWRDVRYSTVNDNADPFILNMNGFQFSQLDHTVDTVVLPIKQRVEANGETLFINLNYVAFTKQIGGAGTPGLVYIHDDADEYAEFVLATYRHLSTKYGWVPDSWEIILEPDNGGASASFRATWAASGAKGTLIGNCVVAAAARLTANGFTPRFVAPSNTCMSNAITYFNQMANVAGAMQHVDEFSYHRYCGVSNTNLSTIAALAAAHGLNTSMLEHIGSGYQDLHKDLKLGNNSAWQQFTLAFPGTNDPGGKYYPIDDSDVNNPLVITGSRTKFLRQYFKFIRRGAVRMGATSDNAGFDPLAFTNVNGTVVVVVKAGGVGTLSIQGLPAGTYGIKFTTPTQYDVDLANQGRVAGEAVVATIPRDGVITIYGISP